MDKQRFHPQGGSHGWDGSSSSSSNSSFGRFEGTGRGGRQDGKRGLPSSRNSSRPEENHESKPSFHRYTATFRGTGRDVTKPIFGRNRVKLDSDDKLEDIITADFITESDTIDYLNKHGRVFFCIRGFPGSSKESLIKILAQTYPTAKIFCAKYYFPPSEGKDVNVRRASHQWCKDLLMKALENGHSPILLVNTFVREFELDNYLNEVRSFAYTIIMLDSSTFFEFDIKDLVKVTPQHLSEEYFKRRLPQWCDYIPWYTGWFLNPADSGELYLHSCSILESIFPTLRARKILNNLDHYTQVKEMFCIAVFLNAGFVSGSLEYYLSSQVLDWCGRMSVLDIVGFLIDPDLLLAIVALSPEQRQLVRKLPLHQELDDGLASSSPPPPQRKVDYKTDIVHSGFFRTLTETLDRNPLPDCVRLEELSLIVLGAANSSTFPYIKNPQDFLGQILGSITSLKNLLWQEKKTGSFFKLSFSQYIFVPYTILQVNTIFTGLF